MIDIIIKDFPLPPSINSAYMPIIGKIKRNSRGKVYGAGRMVKTDQYRDYESKCIKWQLRYQTALNSLKNEILDRKKILQNAGKELSLKLEMYAILPKEWIFTVNGKLENRDADNYNKVCQDNVFKMLCLDDKHVFKNEIQKVSGSKPYMIIRLTEYEPKTEDQIKLLMGIK